MKTNRKKKLNLFTRVFLVFAFVLNMLVGGLVYADTTTNLTDRLTDLKINIWSYVDGSVSEQIIKDNSLVDNSPIVTTGKQYSFKLTWKLTEAAMQQTPHVKEGDYFYIDIGSDHSFKPLEVPSTPLISGGVRLANWEMSNGRIKCTLTKEGAEKSYLSGGFEGYLSWSAIGSDKIQITVNGDPIEQIPAQENQGGGADPNDGEYPYNKHPIGRPDQFIKSGLYQSYNGMISWRLNFGKQNYYDVTKGQPVQKMNNVFIEDTLSQGQEINNVSIQYTLYHPADEAGTPTNFYGVMSNIEGTLFTKLEKGASESESDFRDRVKNYGTPAYGYSDTSVYVNIGNYPNESLKYPSDAQLTQALKNKNFTDKEIETILKNYGENGPEQGKILLFEIVIQTKATAPSENNNNKYKNKATLHYDNQTLDSNEVEVMALNASGNILAGEKGSATLQKSDKENSSALLSGAKFYLEKQVNGSWEKYTPTDGGPAIRETDSDGIVRFEKLTSGTYRFVEEEAAHGYSKGSLEMDNDTFEIDTANDSFGKVVLATNKKLTGKTELTKYKTDTTKAVKDAKFVFYNSNNEYLKIENNIYSWVSDINEAHQFTTDNEGKIAIDNLPVGTYYFKEVEAPKGFVKDETPCEVKIEVSAQNTIETKEVTVYNKETPSQNTPEENNEPDDTVVDNNPGTGDQANIVLFVITALSSLVVGIALVATRSKKRKANSK